MLPWTRKYSPKSLSELVGQDAAVSQLKAFVANFKKEKKKAIMLYGPSGTGKTAAAHAISKDLDLEILELNASDIRNAEEINSIVGSATKQMSLFFKGKLVLIDEIDGVSGSEDRGGVQALAKVIDETRFPIIITANDPWDSKFNVLRTRSVMVLFQSLNYLTIYNALKEICNKEDIVYEENSLKALARHAGGDMRSAINDIQTLSSIGVSEESIKGLSDRNKTETMMNALMVIMKTTEASLAIKAFDNVDEDIDQSFLWIDENLPKEYTKPKDLQHAYHCLSLADRYRGRIRRWQHWDFLIYINAFITAGVAVSKEEKYHSFVKYSPTMRLLKIWQANQRYQKRKQIAQKISEKTHCSKKEALKSTLPYLKPMFKVPGISERLVHELDLDQEEVEWLKK